MTMIRFRSRIEGLERLGKKIDAYDKRLGNDISTELDKGVRLAANIARFMAPKGRTLELVASIGHKSNGRFDKEFFADSPIAAYVEFGTGSRVFEAKNFTFTAEQKEFAREFYVNGLGRMPASPFMFPALEIAKVEIIKNIKKILLKGL